MRGHEGDQVRRECLVREGPKDKNSKVYYRVKKIKKKSFTEYIGPSFFNFLISVVKKR